MDLRIDSGPGPSTEPTPLDAYKLRSPRYPMFGQLKINIDDSTPAANKYDIHSSKAKVMKQNPVCSMFGPGKDFKLDSNPGPLKYDLRSHNPFNRNPVYSMGRRHSEYTHVPIFPMDNC